MIYIKFSLAAGLVAAAAYLAPVWAQSESELALRVTRMEDQMRQLIGQVEQLTFEMKQLRTAGKTGSLERAAPTTAMKKPEIGAAAQAGEGVEQFEDLPSGDEPIVTSIIKEDGAQEEIPLAKAPGPKI